MAGSGAQTILKSIEESWSRFKDAVDQLGVDGIEQPTAAGWSAKEMLGHIAFWDEAVEGAVTVLFRKVPLPDGWKFGSGYVPEDEWPRDFVHNAREAAWAAGQPGAAVLERLDTAHAAFLAFLETVSDTEAAEHADYFRALGTHYRDHQAELDALLARG